jgi:hypothetical protein
MHRIKLVGGALVASLAVLAAGTGAGCKKSEDNASARVSALQGKRATLHGKMKVNGEPVPSGYLLFVAVDPASRPSSDDPVKEPDPANGPPGIFRFGWGKITNGEYKAEQVPGGEVMVTIYTIPEAFERDLDECRIKAKRNMPDTSLRSPQPRGRGGPGRGGPGGMPEEGRGVPPPPVPSNLQLPSSAVLPPAPGEQTLPPELRGRGRGSRAPDGAGSIPLNPRDRERLDQELQKKAKEADRGGPTDREMTDWKQKFNFMSDDAKANILKFNQWQKAVDIHLDQTELDLDMPVPDDVKDTMKNQ